MNVARNARHRDLLTRSRQVHAFATWRSNARAPESALLVRLARRRSALLSQRRASLGRCWRKWGGHTQQREASQLQRLRTWRAVVNTALARGLRSWHIVTLKRIINNALLSSAQELQEAVVGRVLVLSFEAWRARSVALLAARSTLATTARSLMNAAGRPMMPGGSFSGSIYCQRINMMGPSMCIWRGWTDRRRYWHALLTRQQLAESWCGWRESSREGAAAAAAAARRHRLLSEAAVVLPRMGVARALRSWRCFVGERSWREVAVAIVIYQGSIARGWTAWCDADFHLRRRRRSALLLHQAALVLADAAVRRWLRTWSRVSLWRARCRRAATALRLRRCSGRLQAWRAAHAASTTRASQLERDDDTARACMIRSHSRTAVSALVAHAGERARLADAAACIVRARRASALRVWRHAAAGRLARLTALEGALLALPRRTKGRLLSSWRRIALKRRACTEVQTALPMHTPAGQALRAWRGWATERATLGAWAWGSMLLLRRAIRRLVCHSHACALTLRAARLSRRLHAWRTHAASEAAAHALALASDEAAHTALCASVREGLRAWAVRVRASGWLALAEARVVDGRRAQGLRAWRGRAMRELERVRLHRAAELAAWRRALRTGWRRWPPPSRSRHCERSHLRRSFERVLLRAAETMARHDRCGRTLTSWLYRPSLSLQLLQHALELKQTAPQSDRMRRRRCWRMWREGGAGCLAAQRLRRAHARRAVAHASTSHLRVAGTRAVMSWRGVAGEWRDERALLGRALRHARDRGWRRGWGAWCAALFATQRIQVAHRLAVDGVTRSSWAHALRWWRAAAVDRGLRRSSRLEAFLAYAHGLTLRSLIHSVCSWRRVAKQRERLEARARRAGAVVMRAVKVRALLSWGRHMQREHETCAALAYTQRVLQSMRVWTTLRTWRGVAARMSHARHTLFKAARALWMAAALGAMRSRWEKWAQQVPRDCTCVDTCVDYSTRVRTAS